MKRNSHKSAEDALREANELLEQIFSATHFLLAFMDRDFNFIRVNAAYAAADGKTPDYYIGKNHFKLFPHEENERIFRRVVETGETHTSWAKPFEYALNPERGMTYWDWTLAPVKGPGDKVDGVLLSLVNVTERVRAEVEKTVLSSIVEQADESVLITDLAGAIEYTNPAFERLNGVRRVEARGKNPRILQNWKHGDELWETIRGSMRKGEPWSGRLSGKRGSGADFEESLMVKPLRSPDGSIRHYIWTSRDITRESALERQMRRQGRLTAMGSLASGIAHDFNNILTPIIGYTEMTIDEASNPQAVIENARQALAAAKRAKDLIKRILNFCGEMEQELKPINPRVIILETMNFIKAALPSTIKIHEDIDKNAAPIMADPTQISQIIVNLCANAQYAMREKGGELDIILKAVDVDEEFAKAHPSLKPGSYARLTVRDTGSGMTESELERIFEPFYTTKPKGEGTGMGLPTVHGIVTAHEGAITVYSEPGLGTVFNIYLPIIEEGVKEEQRLNNNVPTGQNERILFVDDETGVATVGKRLLEKLGYRVATATDPAVAIKMAAENPGGFDALVTDYTMPGMTGPELCRKIRRIIPGLPVILTTGFSVSGSQKAVVDENVDEVVMKPFSKTELAQAMRRVLEKKR